MDFGPQPLAHPDVVAQPPEISPGEFRRRNDVPHHRPRHIPDRLAAEQETFEKVVLLAADQLAVHAPQRRIEPPVTGQPRTAESHIAAPGNASRRERTHPLSEIHRIGDRHFDVFRHPRRTSRGVFGDDAPPGHDGPGTGFEEFEIGAQKPLVDPFVVVDEGHQRRLRLPQSAVAGVRHPRSLLRDEPQAAPGMRRGKGRETRLGVVRGVVAHHHALPLVARKILSHDGFERRNELCGTVVGGNDERDSNHRANVAIYP